MSESKVNIDITLFLDSLEDFIQYGLPMVNSDREKNGESPLSTEEEITNKYLDLLNEHGHKPAQPGDATSGSTHSGTS